MIRFQPMVVEPLPVLLDSTGREAVVDIDQTMSLEFNLGESGYPASEIELYRRAEQQNDSARALTIANSLNQQSQASGFDAGRLGLTDEDMLAIRGEVDFSTPSAARRSLRRLEMLEQKFVQDSLRSKQPETEKSEPIKFESQDS